MTISHTDTALMDKTVILESIGKKYCFNKPAVSPVDFWALKDINLEAYRGQVLGIIGRNGAGKTTLLNIIAGTIKPTEGTSRLNGRVVGLFNLGVGFQDELSGRDNIFLNGAILGACAAEIKSKIKDIIDFSELGEFVDMPMGSYSQGMKLRLGFSIIANIDFDILTIDEVLAVGDVLFQDKCYRRLAHFKRMGKTLIITSQNTDLISRLSDHVILLDHGRLIAAGDPGEVINRYHSVLGCEKFFVGLLPEKKNFIDNTKKWAEDNLKWGKKSGTKEVSIESVNFVNKLGMRCARIKSGEPVKIKVDFVAGGDIKEPHFGIAIFRKDGVYCYGPNTVFDGYIIPFLRKGKGYFTLYYPHCYLASGEFKVSVAVWDKNEILPFDYHDGVYDFHIAGDNDNRQLLNMPYLSYPRRFFLVKQENIILSGIIDKWGCRIDDSPDGVVSPVFTGPDESGKNIFITNKPARITVYFDIPVRGGNYLLWLGLYRDDRVYCQGFTAPVKDSGHCDIIFPKMLLLPGRYLLSLGIWDAKSGNFIILHHGVYPFGVIFDRQDYGTIYLEHSWRWGQ